MKTVLTEEQEQIIINAYTKGGKGQIACGKLVGVGERIVKRVLNKHGIYIRNFSEAAKRSNVNRRTYKINENYFAEESHNMAYILGFLAADGSVSKKSNEVLVGLAAIDKDFLKAIAVEMGSDKEIKLYTSSNGYDCCKWSCSSEKIKHDLGFYGVIPQKTFQLKFPKHLQKEYWIDYIRGYFDGDGTVSSAGKALRWQVSAATTDVLKTIVEFFYKEYGIPRVKLQEQKRKNVLYTIQYSTTATRKIYDILYTPNSLYLPRKKEKFELLLFG